MSRTLEELASLTGAALQGDPSHLITGVETLEEALSCDASFLSNPRYRDAMLKSRAGDGEPAEDKRARDLFGFSILYLFALFAALLAERGFA